MSMKDWQFPTMCPACGILAGIPYRAKSAGDHIEMALRCTSCRHDWTVCEIQPALLLTRTPDRRESTDASTLVALSSAADLIARHKPGVG